MAKKREYGDQSLPSPAEMATFLEKDLGNDLRWLFDAAVIWSLTDSAPIDPKSLGRHADVHTMHAAVALARCIYEFYFDPGERFPDDARARHFCRAWTATPTSEYATYFAPGAPANKRVLHLAYGRSQQSGGTGQQGDDHLNRRVLAAAKDLLNVTQAFAQSVEPCFKPSAKVALDLALSEARHASTSLGTANPLEP